MFVLNWCSATVKMQKKYIEQRYQISIKVTTTNDYKYGLRANRNIYAIMLPLIRRGMAKYTNDVTLQRHCDLAT